MGADDDNPTDGERGTTEPQATGEAGLRPGDRIGRYVLITSVGQGGMGVVFLAYDPELDRKVALKLLKIGLLDTDGRQRLTREAQALARLSHPNVVPVYDVGTVDDQAFVAMEYVEGQTLKRWLKTPRTWREIVAVMRDAGRGLAAAHAAGLVHRDFKPDNVLIGGDGRVRVVDFGLAREVDDLANPSGGSDAPSGGSDSGSRRRRRTGGGDSGGGPGEEHQLLSQVTRADQIIGTPAYMAPEQLSGAACDERADQFSFGVTFYEALFRTQPYDTGDTIAANAMVTIAQKQRHPARQRAADPPRGSDVPSWVQKIVMRALAIDPIHRFPSMEALLADLDRDPAVARRRLVTIGAMVLLVALGAAGLVRGQAARRRLCQGASDEVQRAWSAARRERVRAAFAASGLPYAERAAESLTRLLDRYASDWSNQYKDACEATRVRGEVSEAVLDLRMACLGDRLEELAALTSVMEHPDKDTIREASRAAQALAPVSECADVAALKAQTPRPRDGAQAARVEQLEQRLAAMQAQHAVGKNLAAIALGEKLLPDARAVGWLPLVAKVELWLGRAHADEGDDAKSIPAFKDAFAAALGGRADNTLAEAAVRLTQELVYKNDMPAFSYWERVAHAALMRGPPDPHLESFLAHTHCVALYQLGKVKERLRCLEEHARRSQRPLNEWELTMLGIAADDAGEPAEGVDWLRKGVDFSTREFGPTHPRTLEMRGYLCKGLLDLGQYGQALDECQAALRTVRQVSPDNEYLISRIQLYLGVTLREMKQYAEAKKLLVAAQKGVKPEGEVLVELATLARQTGDRKSALAYYRKSLADDEKELPPGHASLIVDRVLLGETLLADGALDEARAQLERAHKWLTDDLSPFLIADVDFDYARALWLADPAAQPRALELARKARRLYEAAPRTDRFQQIRAHIDRWIADESARRDTSVY